MKKFFAKLASEFDDEDEILARVKAREASFEVRREESAINGNERAVEELAE